MASQFLVFMLVSLDGLWHQLIGYWFTNHVNADNLYQSSNQQIKYIMRKLIVIKCGGLSTSLNMNCSTVHVDFEFVESDSVPENFMETIIEFSGQLTHQPDSVHAPVLDNFKRRVLCYIGGYIVKKLLPHVTCKECKAALVNNVEDPLDTADERLIQLKTNGALLSPAKSTFEIIIKAEEVFLTEVIGKNKSPVIENINDYLSLKVIRLLEMAKLFPTLEQHALQQNPALENVHSVWLQKLFLGT